MQINSQVQTAQEFDNIVVKAKKTDVFLVLGQSNAVHGVTKSIIVDDNINDGVGNLIYTDVVGEIKYKPLGTSATWIDPAFKRAPFHSKLARLMADKLGVKSVDIAVSYKGSTGFSGGHWTGQGDQLLWAKKLIRDLIINKNKNIAGITWWQGEADTSLAATYAPVLDALISGVRALIFQAGQEDGYTVPFITGRMHPDSLAVASPVAGLQEVDDALRTVGTRVAYTAGVDLTGIPSRGGVGDNRHFTAEQQKFLATAISNSFDTAKLNTLNDQLSAGSYLLYKTDQTGVLPSKFSVFDAGVLSPTLTGNLKDLVKAVNPNGYRLRYEAVISGVTEHVEWYQREHPLLSTANETQVQVISASADFHVASTSALFYGATHTTSSGAMFTLSDNPAGSFAPVGAVQSFNASGFGIYATNTGTVIRATSIKLFAIKE